ncbi:hypothetical protein Tco_0668931, partial [Tanacetum coccineum]
DKKILSTAVNLWIRNLVIRKRVEDFQLGIESYQTQLNLTKPRWEATGLEFMHDYKILDSSRAVLFRDKYGMQMLMRFNKIHKFNDGTLQQIDEALDYRVKEFKVNKINSGMNTRYEFPRSRQSQRDLPRDNSLVSVEVLRYDYKRSNVNKGIVQTKMELVLEHTQQGTSNEVSIVGIEKVAVCSNLRSLKLKRIIEVLRIILVILPEHPSDTYVLTMKMEILLELTSNKLMVDPILMLEILSRRFFLRLNLPDHRSVLTDSKVHIKMEMASTCSSRVKFIATCSYSRLNDFATSME